MAAVVMDGQTPRVRREREKGGGRMNERERKIECDMASQLYMWGENEYGQLGTNSLNRASLPTRVEISNVADVSCGRNHTLCVTVDGQMYSWGYGSR